MRRIIVAFLIVAGALAWRRRPCHRADPEPRLILAPSGVLRAGLYPGTPTSILPDAGSGEPRGVGYDLGKELARRLGVPYEPVVFAKNAEVLAAVKSGGSMSPSPMRRRCGRWIWISARPFSKSSSAISSRAVRADNAGGVDARGCASA